MKLAPLQPSELVMIAKVFARHPEIAAVKLFGSRAKGTHQPYADVDLVLWGEVDALRAESIAAELDELPLPYRFDVMPFAEIELQSLRDHIERVGISLYPISAVAK